MKKVRNLEDELYSLLPTKVTRFCSKCQILLPQSNYFHCEDCKCKVEDEEGSDTDTYSLPEGFGE